MFIKLYFAFTGLGSEVALLCSSCNESFLHPWDLLVHVQKTHSLHIFEESDDMTIGYVILPKVLEFKIFECFHDKDSKVKFKINTPHLGDYNHKMAIFF